MYPYFPAEKTEAKRGKANDLFQVQSPRSPVLLSCHLGAPLCPEQESEVLGDL